MKLEKIDLSTVTSLRVQSPQRTTDSAIRYLHAVISKSGFVVPPVVYRNGRDFLVDGYRRRACLRDKKCICLVVTREDLGPHTPTPEELFAALNAPLRKPSGSEWMYGWARSSDPKAYLASMPGGPRKSIVDLCGMVSEATAKEWALSADGCTITLPSLARSIAAILVTYPGDEYELLDLCRWIRSHGMSNHVYRILREPSSDVARALRSAIAKNRPLKTRKGS